jgi:hypothetical protein
MSLFDPSRCPNCNSNIDLKDLWRYAPKTSRGSQLAGHIGIVCPVCGIKLRVLQGRLQITSIALFILLLSSALVLGRLRLSYGGVKPLLIGLGAVYLAGYVLFQKSIPRLLQLRILEEGEQAGFPLVTLAEDLAVQREAAARDGVDLEPVADTGPKWICANCGDENPGNFDECWKCQTWRVGDTPGSGDPPATVK